MQGILKFDLPQDDVEFATAQNGWRYKSTLAEFDNWLRGKLKYETLKKTEQKLFQEVRDKLWEVVRDNGVEDIH